jgi:acyl carrier protein
LKKAASTFERVKKVLSEPIFLLEPDNITPSAELVGDFIFDDHDHAELAIALEEEFKIQEITDEEIANVSTVADLVKLMEQKKPKVMGAKA